MLDIMTRTKRMVFGCNLLEREIKVHFINILYLYLD